MMYVRIKRYFYSVTVHIQIKNGVYVHTYTHVLYTYVHTRYYFIHGKIRICYIYTFSK